VTRNHSVTILVTRNQTGSTRLTRNQTGNKQLTRNQTGNKQVYSSLHSKLLATRTGGTHLLSCYACLPRKCSLRKHPLCSSISTWYQLSFVWDESLQLWSSKVIFTWQSCFLYLAQYSFWYHRKKTRFALLRKTREIVLTKVNDWSSSSFHHLILLHRSTIDVLMERNNVFTI
jgi:hypothetical protein